jgi:hypothetical protein
MMISGISPKQKPRTPHRMGLRPFEFAMSPHAIAKITPNTTKIPALKPDDEFVLVCASAAAGVASTLTPTTTADALILRTVDTSPSLLR